MNKKKYDYLKGERFGKLTVISSDVLINGRKRVECTCDCGNKLFVRVDQVSKQKSCGCIKIDRKGSANNLYIDGRSKDKLYNVWFSIKHRVFDVNCKPYKHYGARGIGMCNEWLDYAVFKKWAMSNGYKDKLTIERIDNDYDYCPENCKWVTMLEQGCNKRNTRSINYLGKNKTIREWCDILNLKYGTESSRVYRNFHKTGEFKLSIS